MLGEQSWTTLRDFSCVIVTTGAAPGCAQRGCFSSHLDRRNSESFVFFLFLFLHLKQSEGRRCFPFKERHWIMRFSLDNRTWRTFRSRPVAQPVTPAQQQTDWSSPWRNICRCSQDFALWTRQTNCTYFIFVIYFFAFFAFFFPKSPRFCCWSVITVIAACCWQRNNQVSLSDKCSTYQSTWFYARRRRSDSRRDTRTGQVLSAGEEEGTTSNLNK